MARMHEVDVVVPSLEDRQDQVAEFTADGRTFATSRLLDEQVVIEFSAHEASADPVIVDAHSLMLALERARSLLS